MNTQHTHIKHGIYLYFVCGSLYRVRELILCICSFVQISFQIKFVCGNGGHKPSMDKLIQNDQNKMYSLYNE